jgi:hypothetical protein
MSSAAYLSISGSRNHSANLDSLMIASPLTKRLVSSCPDTLSDGRCDTIEGTVTIAMLMASCAEALRAMTGRIAKRWKGIRKVVGRGKILFDNRMFDMEERRRGLRVRLLVCVRESKRNREGKDAFRGRVEEIVKLRYIVTLIYSTRCFQQVSPHLD